MVRTYSMPPVQTHPAASQHPNMSPTARSPRAPPRNRNPHLKTQGKRVSVNVTKLTDSTEFRTSAAEMYTTFTDPGRITAFTRSAPIVFEGAKPGGKFELFGGNVSGSFVELVEPTKIVQKWRLSQWPQGHFSTLSIRFEQNDVDGVTVMRVIGRVYPLVRKK